MDNLSFDDLKEIVVYYKEKCSNLELQFLSEKMLNIKKDRIITTLNEKVESLGLSNNELIQFKFEQESKNNLKKEASKKNK